MKIEITDTIRKQIAKEVIVKKSAKTAVAKKFNISARTVGRCVEKFANEFIKKVEEKKLVPVNVDETIKDIKTRVVYTRTGKIRNKPNKRAIEAYLASNGDKEKYFKLLENVITRKAAEHGFYRCRAYLD